MNKKPFVSFISPCYNVNRYLNDYFDSFLPLLKNKSIDFEIIIIDDRGEDDPYKVVKQYEEVLPIVFHRNKKNMGLGFSRNIGLDLISKKSTNVIYIDSDDKLIGTDWSNEIKVNEITWFEEIVFNKIKSWKANRLRKFGKNLFNNSVCGISIPISIANQYKFETKNFEDLLVNRRLVKSFKNEITLSSTPIMGYRLRFSGINSSEPTVEKFKDFMQNEETLIREGLNTYRFNIQEIHQYYWMWRKYLKKGMSHKELTDAPWYYKSMFWFTGSMIRVLHLESAVYGTNNKDSFD